MISFVMDNDAMSREARDFSDTLIEVGNTSGDYRVLAVPPDTVKGVLLDLDGTLYQNPAYRADVARREREAIAEAMGWSSDEGARKIDERREALSRDYGRPARLTETVLSLGLSRNWWDSARDTVYRPERYIQRDERIKDQIEAVLNSERKIGVATNSPSNVARRILTLLGVEDQLPRMSIMGPDTLGISKPEPDFFSRAAEVLKIQPENTLSIGDDEQNDGHPAIETGMGAVIVNNVPHIGEILTKSLDHKEYSPFDLAQFAQNSFRPNETMVIGLTGRAGAGKTTTASNLVDMYGKLGIPAIQIGLDAFFKLSSKGRKAWLEEGKELGADEYAWRADQANWWDFHKAEDTLKRLKQRQVTELNGIYNRSDGGELTGSFRYDPNPRGDVVVFEGVAIAHMKPVMDTLVYVNAHPAKRKGRLLGRDGERRVGDAAHERFQLTQRFESNYFPRYSGHIDEIIENSTQRLKRVSFVPTL